MSKTLYYTHPHHAGKLLEELAEAVPMLRPVEKPDGTRWAVMQLSSRGDDIELTVPNEVDKAAVKAVVDLHTPTAPPPTPDEVDLADIQAALTGNGNLTGAQMKKALRLLFKQAGLRGAP